VDIVKNSTRSHMIQIPITEGEHSSVLSGYASTRVYVPKVADSWILLKSHLGSHMYVMDPVNVSMILQSMRWQIFHVRIPHTTWCICYSPYAHNFDMQTGIPVCKYFSNPRPYAYGVPHMHTAIRVCIILHMGIQPPPLCCRHHHRLCCASTSAAAALPLRCRQAATTAVAITVNE
jgi:hypothetical protein